MCTSGWGFRTAISFRRRKSWASSTNWLFQNMLPSRGRSTGMFCTTTAMVIRKMMSSTSITSTSGVVLICEFRSSSSAWPTCIAMSERLVRSVAAAEQRHLHRAAEAAHLLHGDAVAAHQPVVAEDRGNRDGEAQRGHDERFAHRSCDLVDRRLPGDADRRERMVDAPDRAEQADERRGGADRGEERQPGLQAVVDHVDRAIERHREPAVQVDLLLGHRRMVLYRDAPFLGDEAVGAVVAQVRGAVVHVLGGPELGLGLARVLHHAALLDQLDDGEDRKSTRLNS